VAHYLTPHFIRNIRSQEPDFHIASIGADRAGSLDITLAEQILYVSLTTRTDQNYGGEMSRKEKLEAVVNKRKAALDKKTADGSKATADSIRLTRKKFKRAQRQLTRAAAIEKANAPKAKAPETAAAETPKEESAE
jgi:tRNA A37 threonylcarbamoyladenosine modification protein TsaB